MNQQELNQVLDLHKKWLNDEEVGSRAYLREADLRGADLREANLRGADLREANLRGADLSGADLRGAYLSEADLSRADLSGAYLRGANLREADLSGANLRGADLSGADLSGADLSEADLSRADLSGVIFNENTSMFALQCPEEGSFIGWKKCRNETLVKLQITENSKRSSATSLKCRASECLVLAIEDANGLPISQATSKQDSTFIYEVGKIVRVDNFDENRWNECSTGIHFFISKEMARQY